MYTLMTEVNCDWMPLELLDDPQGCMEYLHKMVEAKTLDVKLSSAFGKWYLYGNVSDVNVIHCMHIVIQLLYCSSFCGTDWLNVLYWSFSLKDLTGSLND